MGTSPNAADIDAPIVSTLREELKFMQASTVNVSNFVSVKLSKERNNYSIWRGQMLCLIESQELLCMIECKSPFPEDKGALMFLNYDHLVKGWILSSLSERLLKDVFDLDSARDVWVKLEESFTQILSDREGLNFKFGIEVSTEVAEIDSMTRKRLYDTAVEGCWWKAKSILKIHRNAATNAIMANGNTLLHLAVKWGHNCFVEKLIEFLKDGKDIEKQNVKGQTALHTAAKFGNTYAAQLLVQKRKELLVILDGDQKSPLDIAKYNNKYDTYAYLLKYAPSPKDEYADHAIMAAVLAKEYDLAEALLEKFEGGSSLFSNILMAITLTFPADLCFMESFIYPSFNHIYQKTVVRGSLLFHSNILDKCMDDIYPVVKICSNACCNCLGKFTMILLVPIATLYQIYQLICLLVLVFRLPFSILYLLLWKALIVVHPIKNIEKKKNDYQKAKKILRLIGELVDYHGHYGEAIVEAIHQDTYEVVDEILFMSPATINWKNEEGHNILQLAIINRSEKVYNLIYHIVETYKDMIDYSENNLAHLVGRLAPSFVLDRSTGAALQLQRELLWREEVEKLIFTLKLRDKNIYEETPAMVFTREHQVLLQQGEAWMKTTAESCSITAALIVTIVFAAAITVPGGNQESGIPIFKKEIAFTIFAISNAFSLFTGATALLLFLSILTARFSEKDFLVSLPRRLILGLLTLILSTTTMIIAFGTVLFLVFCDQRPWMLAIISVCCCVPILVIVTIKVPLLVDLIQSTYFPIFGKKSNLESCKISPKNTIFLE